MNNIKQKISLCIILVAFITGCLPDGKSFGEPTWAIDQCLRREIFKQCLAAVPKGPTSVVDNDWDEVVSECDTAAYRQSVVQRIWIKPGCY